MPEMSPEMQQQILADIYSDAQRIIQQIQSAQSQHGPNKPDWRDLETLDYTATQLVKKIKYLRGDRY